ncbi:MAG: BolA family protein [Rickettsiales bacterium]
MTSIANRIKELLIMELDPTILHVVDDSAKHTGHSGAREGGESHFTVHIVSEKFAGINAVARHRAVYAALKPLLDAGLHALAINAKAPGEA